MDKPKILIVDSPHDVLSRTLRNIPRMQVELPEVTYERNFAPTHVLHSWLDETNSTFMLGENGRIYDNRKI
jgi:hypothetical protein